MHTGNCDLEKLQTSLDLSHSKRLRWKPSFVQMNQNLTLTLEIRLYPKEERDQPAISAQTQSCTCFVHIYD